MAEILVAGLPEAATWPIAQRIDASFRHIGTEAVPDEIDEETTLAVLGPASEGVDLAQVVHRIGPHVAVVYLADDAAEREAVRAQLAITPGIGRHTSCVVIDEQQGIEQAVEEIERSRLRHQHHRTMVQVRGAMGGFEGAPPETLSVYLGQLFEHAPVGILLADPSGLIRAANPYSGDVLGWQLRDAVGARLHTMFSGPDQDVPGQLLDACVRTGSPADGTLTRRGPDGATQHLDITVAPVDPEHWNLGVFVLLRDETARIRALEGAERARRAAEAEVERYAELAWTLQESLLPPDLPDIPGVEVGARYHPAGDGSEIGGDFYDIFQVRDHEWFAVMGDICGKGAHAARLTALTRYTLRAATVRTDTIEQNLTDLNTALARQYEQDRQRNEHRFATATVIRFHRDGDGVVVRAGSGGHAPPLVARADGTVEEVPCRGPLLGVFDTGTFVSGRTRLGPDDVLLLYTDGVTEARRGREEYGEERLRTLLASLGDRPAAEVAAAVEAAVLEFQSGVARDDTAILAIRAARPS